MNQYVTGAIIKRLRENRKMTQQQLARMLSVSDKSVSKWETGRGYPDISLLQPLCAALGVSMIELMSGEDIVNTNRSFNLLRTRLYVCPVCGNVIFAAGEAVVSCHGVLLPPLEAEEPDASHKPAVGRIEDEYFVTVPHEMTKEHFISFVAAVKDDGVELIKLYPEGPAQVRLPIAKTQFFCFYCNRHGLFKVKL